MKKFLALTLLLGSSIVFVSSAEARSKTAPALNNPGESSASVTINSQPRRRRTYIRTRVVRRGYALYRETYRITYRPNGTVRTQLISRVRIR